MSGRRALSAPVIALPGGPPGWGGISCVLRKTEDRAAPTAAALVVTAVRTD